MTETVNAPATTTPTSGAPTPPSTNTPIVAHTPVSSPAPAPATTTPQTPALLGPPQTKEPELPTNRPPLADPENIDPDLCYILSQPRRHGTDNEQRFHNWLITKLNKMKVKPSLKAENCITVEIGKSTTLFSCHIDTVHGAHEQTPYKLLFDPTFEQIFLATAEEDKTKKVNGGADPKWKSTYVPPPKKVASCLGADDGAGVWLMLKMIEAKIPGGYIFHRGEESHGIGSHAMLKTHSEWLKKWTAAVAFDRAGDFEVIHTQGGMLCASTEYTKALCEALTTPAMAIKYEPSGKGTFTDTKVYRNVIAECVNIGVGYYSQHGQDETLDYGHLYALLDIVKKVEWDKLPVKRDPTPAAYDNGYNGGGYGGYGGGNYGGSYGSSRLDEYDRAHNDTRKGGTGGSVSPFPKSPSGGNAANSGANKGREDSRKGGYDGGAEDKFKGREKFEIPSGLAEVIDALASTEDLITWFDEDPDVAAKVIMAALLEGNLERLRRQAMESAYDLMVEKVLGN